MTASSTLRQHVKWAEERRVPAVLMEPAVALTPAVALALADLLDALRLEHSSEAEHARMRLEAAIERTTT